MGTEWGCTMVKFHDPGRQFPTKNGFCLPKMLESADQNIGSTQKSGDSADENGALPWLMSDSPCLMSGFSWVIPHLDSNFDGQNDDYRWSVHPAQPLPTLATSTASVVGTARRGPMTCASDWVSTCLGGSEPGILQSSSCSYWR